MNTDYSQASDTDVANWLRLALTPIPPSAQRKLLSAFGLPGQIFAQSRSRVIAVTDTATAEALFKGPDAALLAATLAWSEAEDNHILTLADAAYPKGLLEISDPPLVLYVKGMLAQFDQPALAMVGARSATAQGEANAEAFARSLASAGLIIVSGLAMGIDAAAHVGALDAPDGRTVAVIGTGIDRIYPAKNAALAHKIVHSGAIVSEFPLGTPPLRGNFPRRNRLIAGMSQGVLVVEAALNSGSLITARLAIEADRDVFAIPGSIHSPMARGCHRLIRNGAKLVETAEDVLEELRPRLGLALMPHSAPQGKPSRRAIPPVSAGAEKILAALGVETLEVDTLALKTGLAIDVIAADLLTLELDGLIARQAGGFQRIHRIGS